MTGAADEGAGARGSGALALGVLLLLLPFVAGDVTWYDAGELTAATAGLGVPHPTGFPLLAILGHALHLLPLGPAPFRAALLSALCVAAATGLAHALAVRHGARPWPAAAGALAFPATFVVWLHGTTVEVYALNAAVLAAVAWLLLRPRPALAAAAFATGLSLGAHVTAPLTAGALWLLVLARERAWRRLPALVALGLAGALVLAYLPLASSRDPWVDWGDPETPARLLRHLTAAGIRESFAGEMGAGGTAGLVALGRWAHLAAGPVPALALAAAAAVLAGTRGAFLAVAAALALAVDLVFSVVLNPMGQADLQTGVPGAWALALLLAVGAGHPWPARAARLAASLAAAALVALAAAERLPDRAPDRVAGAYGRLTLAEVGPGGLLLASSDHVASLGLYLQGIEGYRRDAILLPKQHLADPAVVDARYAAVGAAVPAAFLALPAARQAERVAALARAELPRRPVHWELGDARFDPAVAAVLRPLPLHLRVATTPGRADAPLPALPPPGGALLRAAAAAGAPGFRARRVASDLSRLRGVWHLLRGELPAGARALEEAVALDPDSPPALLNLAAARRREGRLGEAVALLERALALDPSYERARANLDAYRAEAAGGP